MYTKREGLRVGGVILLWGNQVRENEEVKVPYGGEVDAFGGEKM